MNEENPIIHFIKKNNELITQSISNISPMWHTIISLWEQTLKNNKRIDNFIRKHKELIKQSITDIDYDIINNHPILGKCCTQHAFFCRPLYRHINLNERQFTEALAEFLNNDSEIFQAFVSCLINKNDFIKLKCEAERYTENAKNKEDKKKRIDDIIYWKTITANGEEEKGIICLEVKFEANLYNDLKVYEEEIKAIARVKHIKKENITYIVLSENIETPRLPWCNQLWSDIMKKWEKKIIEKSITEKDADMRRYRASLWRKILKWSEK